MSALRWALGTPALLGLAGCVPGQRDVAVEPVAAAASAQVEVRLLGINDFHGALEPPAGGVTASDGTRVPAGGAAYLAAHVARLRGEVPYSLMVAAGDLIGASPLVSSLFHDEPTIEVLGAVGVELAAVGNHEFDEGPQELRRMQEGGCHPRDGCAPGTRFEGASLQYLAANVLTESDETFFPAYAVRAFDGIAIGVIGVTLEGTPSVTTPAGIAGLHFADEVETVNGLIPALQKKGVETIVVVVHEGGTQTGSDEQCESIRGPIVEIAETLDDAVDVLVSGHTHQAYVCEIDGKVVTSAGSAGRLISQIDLTIDRASRDVVDAKARNIPVTRDIEPVAAVQAMVDAAVGRAQHLTEREVGTIEGSISRQGNEAGESVLGDVVADAQLASGAAHGSVVAFMNPGGIRSDLVRDEDGGAVTFGDVFAVHPFENRLVTMTLSGAQLHDLLEAQWRTGDGGETAKVLQISDGSSYRWDPARPVGDRVDPKDVVIGGKPLQLDARYRVTVNDFLASGGDGFAMLAEGTDLVEHGTDVEALDAYLRARAPLPPPSGPRIRQARRP